MRRLLCFMASSLFMLACAVPVGVQSVTSPVTSTNTPLVTSPKKPVTSPKLATVTAYQSLHVRTARMGLRIGYLYHDNNVTLTGKCDHGWAEIQWKVGTAWVNADYLSKNKCSEEQ